MSAIPHGTPPVGIQEFLDDPAFIRVLCGGRGSAKTTGLAEDITRHIFQNAGAKAIVARQTEVSQADSSIDTFWQFFEKLGPLYSDAGPGLFKSWNNGRTFRVPSRRAIERFQELRDTLTTRAEIAHWLKTEGDRLCGYIEFRGLPDADKGKFRGMECSHLALVEADQIAQKQFALCLACLRWKGADPDTCDEKGYIKDRSVVLDTNPPGPSHWIATMEKEQAALAPEQRSARFWHLCTDDNAHNLPEGYIEQTIMLPYRNNPAMIQRMRYGRYADAFDGKPVYYNYETGAHEGSDLPWPRGAYLIRGWDFGTNNAVVWSAYWKEDLMCREWEHNSDGKLVAVDKVRPVEFWHDLLEQYLESSDTDAQATAAVGTTKEEFPFWNDRNICAGLLDYCDPAGANSTYTRKIEVNGKQVTESAVNILRTHGVYPGYMTSARGLQETIAIVNRLFLKRVHLWNPAKGTFDPVPVYRVDASGCPLLCRGMRGGYRYPILGESGYGQNVPLKGAACEDLDHCFTAGTLILTSRGNIPIEDVKIGDMVFTRMGLRCVVNTMHRNAHVRDYRFSNGTVITSTPEHPFWSASKEEWISIEQLTHEDTIEECNRGQKLLSIVGEFIAGILTRKDAERESTLGIVGTSTTMCGKTTTDLDRRGFIYTTRTVIAGTTTLETLNYSRRSSTSGTHIAMPSGERNWPPTSEMSCNHLPPSGTDQMREENGTWNTRKNSASESASRQPSLAISAGENLNSPRPRELNQGLDFARMPAKAPIVARLVWTMWTRFARLVSGLLGATNTTTARVVRESAVARTEGPETVFNITVEGTPEYYANGILVHNCQDSSRYAKINCLKLLSTGNEATAKPNFAAQRGKNPNPQKKMR